MRFAIWLMLAALVVSLGCGGGGGGLSTGPQTVSLAYKKAGGEYIQYKASTSITYNVGGTIRQSLHDITYSVRVDSIYEDGAIDRRLKFDEFVMGELSGSRLELDPDAEKYKGEALYLKIGPDGELVDWKGLDGIRGYTVSETNLKDDIVQMMTEFFQPLADEEVGVGSTFQRVVEIPVRRPGGDIDFSITIDYKVEGFGTRDGRACVKLKTESLIEAEGEGERGGGRKYWVSLTGDGGGEFWFDYENGLPVESSGKATITSDFSYERAGKEDVATQFATIDVETKTKIVQ
jgi:hypothetical protein